MGKKRIVEGHESDEIRNLDNLEEKAENAGSVEKTSVIGQRDEDGEVSEKKVVVNSALGGDVAVFDDKLGIEIIFVPGEEYYVDPKTAEKKYHDIPLFVDAE